MQKQPKYCLNILQISLPESFPFTVTNLYTQGDKEITDLHVHDSFELGYCYEGTGVFVVENKVLPFKQGDISVISSSEMHLAQSTQGTVSKWRWVYFDVKRLLFPVFKDSKLVDTTLFSGPAFQNIINSEENPQLCSLIHESIEVFLNKEPFYRNEIISQICLFMTHLHKSTKNESRDRIQKYESDTLERIQQAIVYITNNYHQAVKLKDLASLCHLSPNHFRRLFQQALDKSPIQYLNHVRITMASTELMHSKKPIGIIAHDCGFNSISSFNRQFKAQTGISPRKFRG